MSIERVKAYFAQYGMEDRIHEFTVSSATVELAAQAAGVEPGRIAKSLSFKLEDRTILVVAAGDVKVDNGKYKAAFGGKAKMLTPTKRWSASATPWAACVPLRWRTAWRSRQWTGP